MKKWMTVVLLMVLHLVVQAGERPRVIHVIVALCDNAYQGIVPVPEALGNGDKPGTNLYWGAMYGVRTVFDRSADWIRVRNSDSGECKPVLERLVYRSTSDPHVMLVADAYQGRAIRKAISDFLNLAAGHPLPVRVDGIQLPLPELVVYAGHNGLMDFSLPACSPATESRCPGVMVLACKSRDYFEQRLLLLGARPVLLTTGFMAPEAYVLEAALAGWMAGEPGGRIRKRAAMAFNRYQKCGQKAAMRLFVIGPR